ncbi:hypothetical protein VIOR3934_05194 [Vibrio orientalis CIP 102891 = ATCC 33934]|uniref:Uncharacterized protein n=1 Tax=Vibrio orientalis CIP 102891 = ATCC 33934 TaxID=675816 RepID=C9QFB4_VIBOR|nr:hypothetical protein [Vibrio orientalis]EEX94882.1 hypothetical protein VIA_002044 [Vibrio orientalis CIP 102891 = ATCC 33934]EGU52986.1 hypothetical protein VIOR3934_05194 [Vibrio orientalis CIP 102891 = ATCC 33934]
MDFTEKLRLRGKAEEDLYFAHVDQELIEAIHNNPHWLEEHQTHHPDDEPTLVDTLSE